MPRAADVPQGAQAISRAAQLLRAIPRGAATGRRLKDLAGSVGLTEPTARRILKALVREQLVAQDPATKLYRLGPLAFELGLASDHHAQIIEACRPHLRALAAETGDTVFLTRRSGLETVCLDRVDGSFPIRAAVAEIGQRMPLGVGTGGVVLLSAFSDAEVAEVLAAVAERVGAYNRLSVEEILARVAATRRKGYADIADKPIPGVRGIGTAVPAMSGPPVLAMSIAAVHARLPEERVPTVCQALHRTAGRIAAQLHG